MNKTLPVRPKPTPRSLRSRWRVSMLLGANALALIVVGCAVLVGVLEERSATLRMQDSAIRQTHASLQQSMRDAQRLLALVEPTPAGLEAALAAHPALRRIAVVDAQGKEAVAVGAASSEPESLLITAPRGDMTVIANVDTRALWQPALSVSVGDEGYVYVVDDAGALLATGDALRVAADPASFTGGDGALRLYQGVTGDWVLGQAERYPEGYAIVVETPLTEFVPLAVRAVALLALALALAAVINQLLMRIILRPALAPLNILTDAARAVSAADYRYRVRIPAQSDREWIALGDTFNLMLGQLAESRSELDAYNRETREIIDQRARELSRKATRLEMAADIANIITGILDERALAEEVTALIERRFQVYHVELLLVDAQSNKIRPANRHRQAHFPDLTVRDSSSSVVAWVARNGHPLYIPNVAEEPRYRRAPDLPASQSELALPLKVDGAVIGVLNLEADHRDAFPKDDRAVLENLADKIAVALRNAQKFKQLEDANRDLAQATLQANQANTLKSRFLFNASHKLRTPLNSIIGYSETIISGMYGPLPEKAEDRQRRILENGRVLQALVEDMLDLSALETGQLQLKLDWISLPPLLEEITFATQALRMTAHPNHGLDIRLDLNHLTEPLPPVWADIERLRYILINLTSNAVKFTPAGEVRLSADFDDEWVRIRVRDTGTGISQDERRYLFEPFQHQRGSTGVQGKGTGLGLPVSRLLAMRHGGDLVVESVVDQGSAFTLILPRHPDGAPPPPRR